MEVRHIILESDSHAPPPGKVIAGHDVLCVWLCLIMACSIPCRFSTFRPIRREAENIPRRWGDPRGVACCHPCIAESLVRDRAVQPRPIRPGGGPPQ